jgi:hypothetical protein
MRAYIYSPYVCASLSFRNMNSVIGTEPIFTYLPDITFQNGGKLLLLMIPVKHECSIAFMFQIASEIFSYY